jgi:hypothetical protein
MGGVSGTERLEGYNEFLGRESPAVHLGKHHGVDHTAPAQANPSGAQSADVEGQSLRRRRDADDSIGPEHRHHKKRHKHRKDKAHKEKKHKSSKEKHKSSRHDHHRGRHKSKE